MVNIVFARCLWAGLEATCRPRDIWAAQPTSGDYAHHICGDTQLDGSVG